MEDPIIPDMAEVADDVTRKALLAQAENDRRFRALNDHLRAANFVPATPLARVARRGPVIVRHVVTIEYTEDAGARRATLAFGRESAGDTWALALVTVNDRLDQQLTATEAGEIVATEPDALPPLAW